MAPLTLNTGNGCKHPGGSNHLAAKIQLFDRSENGPMSRSAPTDVADRLTQHLHERLQHSITQFEPAWASGRLTFIGGGIESFIFKLNLDDRSHIALKVPMVRHIDNDNDCGIDAFGLLQQEARIFSFLQSHRFPVPTPIGLHLPEEDDAIGFLAMEYIVNDGSPANADELGALLRTLHGLPAPAFQPIADRLASWDATVAHLVRQRSAVIERLAGIQLPEISQEVLREFLRLERAPVSLLHMDPRPENILCSRGQVRGLIDWSNCLIAPPALEVYRVAEYGAGDDAFQESYGMTIQGEKEGDPTSLTLRLYTATMLAVVFLSEAPDRLRAEYTVQRVRQLYSFLERKC